MQSLLPMVMKERYFAAVEREIQRVFDKVIYAPLLRVLRAAHPEYGVRQKEMKNARPTKLDAALRRGQVWYDDGKFTGQFNAQLTVELRSLGAKYNRQTRSWALPSGEVPAELKFAIADASSRAEGLRKGMLEVLDEARPEYFTSEPELGGIYEKVLDEMETDFKKTVPKAIDTVSVTTTLAAAQKEMIAEEWATNLELYIQGWAEENVLKLRQEIQAPVLGGARSESMHEMLQKNYGVSKRKAKFLARQETSLLMAKYHETRLTNLGITEYQWIGADDERERPDHRALNNKIFSFSEPPVTNRKTGARNNPGEDYNCRCKAKPVIR